LAVDGVEVDVVVMSTKSTLDVVGGCVIGMAALWSVVAAPLSANLVISVLAEFASYWLALFVVLFGGYMLLRSQKRPIAPRGLRWKFSCVGLALLVVIVSWRWSDDQFLFWKMRAIPSRAWPQMASDLEAFGKQAAQSGNDFLPRTKPPKSLQQLGLGVDYSGGVANVWNSPQYTGVFAVMTFGYKVRCWGLLLGPEERAKSYCHGGSYVRVSSNAFFFVGPRG
jgi:hypothetical protein